MIEHTEVIIVDHDSEQIAAIAQILQNKANVKRFTTSTECLNHLKPGANVDVLFLSAQNTLVLDLVEWIRSDERYAHLPLLLMITPEQIRDEGFYYAKGVSDILFKPLRSPRVLAAFKHFSEHKRLHDFVQNQEQWLASSLDKRLYDLQLSLDLSLDIVSNLVAAREEMTGQKLTQLKRNYELILRKLQNNALYSNLIDEKYIIRTVKACPLHDIGKLGIPDVILLKKDKLTADEFTLIKTHTTLGYDSIRHAIETTLIDRLMASTMNSEAMAFFREALNMAKYHHERWDGNGYPEGLKGTHIPLSARIMALVDVFDALTNKKVYKDAWSIEKTYVYIKENSGTQFDPDVVQAFAQAFEQIRKEYERRLKMHAFEAA